MSYDPKEGTLNPVSVEDGEAQYAEGKPVFAVGMVVDVNCPNGGGAKFVVKSIKRGQLRIKPVPMKLGTGGRR